MNLENSPNPDGEENVLTPNQIRHQKRLKEAREYLNELLLQIEQRYFVVNGQYVLGRKIIFTSNLVTNSSILETKDLTGEFVSIDRETAEIHLKLDKPIPNRSGKEDLLLFRFNLRWYGLSLLEDLANGNGVFKLVEE